MKKPSTVPETPTLPFVSIILPIRNEAAYIARALAAVLAQDYPADRLEVLIADGLSEDGTRDIVAGLMAAHPARNIQVLDNPGRIVPTGLNAALPKARGSILIRVDGHCEIAPDYISNCVHHLQASGAAGVGGPIDTIGETFLARIIAVGMSSAFGVGGSAFRTLRDETREVDTVAFPAYPRATIELAGLFDEELVRNQDDEYNYRIRSLGGRLLLTPDIQSRYYSRASIRSLWRQYFQYGFWKVRVLQKHPRQMSLRQFIPPLFTAALLGSAALALFFPFGRLLLALTAGSYLAANLTASFLTAARRGWHTLPLLPIVFAVLHLAYGSGFLLGLLRFARRWRDKSGQIPEFAGSDA